MNEPSIWHVTITRDDDAKPLSREREHELWPLARSGDKHAETLLLKSQWRLVYNLATRYLWTGCDLDDLIGWGMSGLWIAYRKFRPETGNKFSTVAQQWIRNEIGHYAPRLAVLCSVPGQFFSAAYREKHSECSGEAFEQTKHLFGRNRIGWIDNDLDYHDQENQIRDLENDVDCRELAEIIAIGLTTLEPRKRSILKWRMQQRTLDEIGEILGITRERVRQLEGDAHMCLKAWIKANHPSLADHR